MKARRKCLHLEDLVEAAADVRRGHLAVVQGDCHGRKGNGKPEQDAAKYEHGQVEGGACDYDAHVEQQPRYQHRPLAPVLPATRTSDSNFYNLIFNFDPKSKL